MSSDEDRTQDAASRRTVSQHTTNQLFRPPSNRTVSQHTTNQLFRPPSNRTASPTHYQGAIPAPIKQDSQPNTLPTSYSGPHQTGQPAQHTTMELLWPPSNRTVSQHTTNQLFRPPSNRTASPTHYQGAIPAPIKQDSQPNTLPTSYSGPHQTGQPAQHTTKELFRPPSNRTASPTHYQGAIPAPIKQDSEPNTLPRSYSGPHQTGQPVQHTTKELFRPPSNRTASPTHYQGAIPAPIKQDSEPNTLPRSYSGPHQTGQ